MREQVLVDFLDWAAERERRSRKRGVFTFDDANDGFLVSSRVFCKWMDMA
jgi:hypothetical protein